MPKHDALHKIATHYGLTIDQLLAGGEGRRNYTPAMLPPDSAADAHTAQRLAAPSYVLTMRERVAQLAVAGFDAAQSKGKAAQFETLMQHISGIAAATENWDWHREQVGSIIDTHFGSPPPAGDSPPENDLPQ